MWNVAKSQYRAAIDKFRAANVAFDNMGLVQTIVQGIPHEMACKLAARTLPAVEAGLPIQPLPNEKQQGNPMGFRVFSPQRQFLDHDFYGGQRGAEAVEEAENEEDDDQLAQDLFKEQDNEAWGDEEESFAQGIMSKGKYWELSK